MLYALLSVVTGKLDIARPRISWRKDAPLLLVVGLIASIVAVAPLSSFRPAKAAPMSLTFETTTAASVSLGTLASRSQCGALSKQGVGPYTMTGTDSRSGVEYSFVTGSSYSGAGLRESGIALSSSMTYNKSVGQTYSGKSNVLTLASTGNITWSNSCNGYAVYGSAFGPEVYTTAFQATNGQALSFNWAAAGGQDDYEVYAFLVKVLPSGASYDYGGSGSTLASNTTLLAHGRGKSQGWTTSTGLIPEDGFYRFRFVNGTFDASGGYALGAQMYIDPNVLVGQANSIAFSSLSDRVTSSSVQTFAVTGSTSSGGVVTFSSSTSARCTVGSSTLSGGVSTATVTVINIGIGLCTITADSASTGDYTTAASVARSFTILAAPTVPTNSGGTSVTGTASVGSTLTANDGSWGDGGSAFTATGYRWQVCPNPASCAWVDVVAAISSTYLLGSSDVGKQFRIQVSKTNGIGTTTATSTATSTAAKGTQVSLTIPITSVAFGSTLALSTSGGSGAGLVSYSVASGTCTLSGNILTVGNVGSSCVVGAIKASDVSYNEASSSNTTVSVIRANQAVLLLTSTSGTFGVDLVLATSGGSGTGAVSYAVTSGACSVSGATLTASSAGSSCVVTATKGSETNYEAISTSNTTVQFAKGTQTPLAISSVSAIFGLAFGLSTSGGSGAGAVSYAISSGSCSSLGAILLMGDAGSSCEVIATKAGNDDYNSVSSVATSITTAKATQSALTVTSTSTTYGHTLASTTSGGSGSGSVSFVVVSGTCSIVGTSLTPGNAGSSCVIKATKATDTNYNEASSSNTTVTIGKANQTGLNVTNSNSFTTGSTLALTASGGQTSGSLSWALQSSEACSLSGTSLSANRGGINCVVEVTRPGDNNYLSDSATKTITVSKIVQTLTFRSTSPSSPAVGSTYTVSVESDASLTPTIVIATTSALVCSIAAGVVTFNTVGTCIISASQPGSDTDSAAAASQSVAVIAAPATTTTLPSSGNSGSTTVPVVTTTVPQSVVAAAPSATTTVPQSTVAAAPSSTTPMPQSTVAAAPSSTTPMPQSAVAAAPSSTRTSSTTSTSTTTTTTTTTTTPTDSSKPVLDVDGMPTKLVEGETTALIRGELVAVETSQDKGQLVMKLPNNVKIRVGTKSPDGQSVQVSPDGILRVLRNSRVAIELSGFVPGTMFTIFMFSTPIELGRGSIGTNGVVSRFVTLPELVEVGSHTLQVNALGPGRELVSVSIGIKIEKKPSNTAFAFLAISIAILLALLGGRPIFKRRLLLIWKKSSEE